MTDKELNGEDTLQVAPMQPLEPVPDEVPERVNEGEGSETPPIEDTPVEDTSVEDTSVENTSVEEPIIDKERDLEASYQQKNFAFLRKQNEDLANRLAEFEKPKVAPEPEIDDEDIISGKQFKQYKKEQSELRFQVEQTQFKASMVSRFPDYNQVMSDKNIKAYMEKQPATAAALANSTDWKSSVEALYGLVKDSGVTKKPATFDREKQKAQANLSKPRASASVSPQVNDSAIGAAANFMGEDAVEARRKSLWQQTINEAKSF